MLGKSFLISVLWTSVITLCQAAGRWKYWERVSKEWLSLGMWDTELEGVYTRMMAAQSGKTDGASHENIRQLADAEDSFQTWVEVHVGGHVREAHVELSLRAGTLFIVSWVDTDDCTSSCGREQLRIRREDPAAAQGVTLELSFKADGVPKRGRRMSEVSDEALQAVKKQLDENNFGFSTLFGNLAASFLHGGIEFYVDVALDPNTDGIVVWFDSFIHSGRADAGLEEELRARLVDAVKQVQQKLQSALADNGTYTVRDVKLAVGARARVSLPDVVESARFENKLVRLQSRVTLMQELVQRAAVCKIPKGEKQFNWNYNWRNKGENGEAWTKYWKHLNMGIPPQKPEGGETIFVDATLAGTNSEGHLAVQIRSLWQQVQRVRAVAQKVAVLLEISSGGPPSFGGPSSFETLYHSATEEIIPKKVDSGAAMTVRESWEEYFGENSFPTRFAEGAALPPSFSDLAAEWLPERLQAPALEDGISGALGVSPDT